MGGNKIDSKKFILLDPCFRRDDRSGQAKMGARNLLINAEPSFILDMREEEESDEKIRFHISYHHHRGGCFIHPEQGWPDKNHVP